MNGQTQSGLVRTGSIIMLVGIFLFPMLSVDSGASVTLFNVAIRPAGVHWLPVLICAIGLLVSSWITNKPLVKAIQFLLQTGFVGSILWTVFTKVWTGQVPGIHFEFGFWIICLGFVIALIGTLVPKETPGK